MAYDHIILEQKWQKFWEENNTFRTQTPPHPLTPSPSEKGNETGTSLSFRRGLGGGKKYILDMFPYPSGAGLHVGHPKGYTATDIVSRYYHAKGYNVLHTMGWDAFGLPAENYAVKTGTHPRITTEANIATFTSQMKALGFSYDWDRQVDTTDPEYYKWTQWIFLELFKKGLAYEAEMPVNWCPALKAVLANEEVVDGKSEIGGHPVEKKLLRQWVLKITEYADRLIEDLDLLDWPEGIKEMQRNWIGKSEGCEFKMKKSDDATKSISVYTTRVDTVYSMAFAVVAPDHPKVQEFITDDCRNICDDYIRNTKAKTDLDRTNDGKEKTGVFSGSYVVNPYNGESVPLWIGDFVLGTYGTGAVFGDAHDERDFEFAKKYAIDLKVSILPASGKPEDIEAVKNFESCLTDDGVLVNSLEYDGLTSAEARRVLAEKAEKEGFGHKKVNYKLRDWLFSRQRYWGEPIPLIHISNEDYERLPSITEKDNIPYITLSGKSTPRSEEGVKKFDPVNAIVKHWSEDSYIVLTFKNRERGLVGGSVESGETREEAIIREVQEETGYKNVSIEKLVIPEIYSRGYKERKNLEEEAKESIYLVKILNDEKISHGVDEGIVSVDLIESEKVSDYITLDHHRFYWDYFYKNPYAYRVKKSDGEYLFINGKEFSKVYDGLTGKLVIDSSLPLLLPEVEKYEPSGDGQSPLATVPEWVNVKLADNLVGRRETNTMPQWGGSCWYYLRYMDAHNPDALASREAMDYWQNVDEYVGGAEHAVLHLLYARFWHKVLYDIGVVLTVEPFQKLTNVGMILAYAYERADGGLVAVDLVEEREGKYYETSTGLEVKQIVAKMSKSLKNVVNPTDVVHEYGADTLRLYEMSMGAFTDTAPWNTEAIIGVRRFLDKAYGAFTEGRNMAKDDMKAMKLLHKTVKKVGEDIVEYKFNTAISSLMILLNEGVPTDPEFALEWKEKFTILLHPFAPHMAEELWNMLGKTNSVYDATWPEYDDFMLVDDEVTIAIQVNGKLRGTLTCMNGVMQEEVSTLAHENPDIYKWIEGKTLVKEIFIPNKMLSIVVKD